MVFGSFGGCNMPAQKRYKTRYPGVYYIEGKAISTGKPERIYYIMYRKDGKQIHEKAGRQFQDDMSPARAAKLRALKIEGDQLSNKEKREAEEARKRAAENKWTVSKLWDAYLSNQPNLKGITTDKNRFENYIEPHFGEREPRDILPLDIDRLRLKLLKKKAPATVRNILELLRRIINFGVKKQLSSGLSFIIEMPTVNNEKTENLTSEQLVSLLNVLESYEDIQACNMMRLVLFTGMRRGEMFRLKWDHINFHDGFILLVDPKGGKDEKIPLTDSAREVLSSHPRAESEYVFPGRGGRQRVCINKQVNEIKQLARLPKDFRALHGLRHTYASILASSGKVDLYTLQKLMTHKSPQMTQRYAHLRDESLQKAANVAGDVVNEALKDKKKNVVDLKK